MAPKQSYPRIWVKAAPSKDPAHEGKEVVRMPWNKERQIGNKPIEVEKTPAVLRMLNLGDIVEVPAPEGKE